MQKVVLSCELSRNQTRPPESMMSLIFLVFILNSLKGSLIWNRGTFAIATHLIFQPLDNCSKIGSRISNSWMNHTVMSDEHLILLSVDFFLPQDALLFGRFGFTSSYAFGICDRQLNRIESVRDRRNFYRSPFHNKSHLGTCRPLGAMFLSVCFEQSKNRLEL